MKTGKKKGFFVMFCALLLAAVLCVPCDVAAGEESGQTAAAGAEEKKDVIKLKKQKNGKYRCYKNGKLIKNKWMTINGKRYYFKKNGDAATLSTKIKGTYYIFNTKGQLQKPASTKIIKIGKKKYQVTSKGKAKKGWAKGKKYYFGKNGEMYTGTRVIGEKFYAFSSQGKYNAAKTKKLQKAAKYEKNISSLKKLIGKPKKKTYYGGSCYGKGKDGIWLYTHFTVYTFKAKSGKELFMGAEAR